MVQGTLEEEVEMMSIMEEQRTENEFRVESDKQFHHQDLLFFSLSLASPISHPPPSLAWHSLSSAHSLSFNYFVIDIIFLLSFVLFLCVLSLNGCACAIYDASQSLLLFVYIALLHAV